MKEGFKPANLKEALKIRASYPTVLFAGGTDLMVQKARGFRLPPAFPKPLLFITQLSELKNIYVERADLHIGSAVTLNDLLKCEIIPEIMKTIISQMGSLPTRNLATIGGNICNASPAGDILPYLYAMDAYLVLQSYENTRKIKINEFIKGPGKTELKTTEILTEIIIPNKKFEMNYYRKVGTRKGMTLSKCSFLGMADTENLNIIDIRIAFGAVAPTIVRERKIENMLIGCKVTELSGQAYDIPKNYAKLIKAIDDARSSRKYRENISLSLLEDFLNKLCQNKHSEYNN